MVRKALLVAVAMLLFVRPAWGRTVVVAVDASFPPMESLNAQNEIVGYDVDFMKAVAKEAGFDVAFKNVEWDSIFKGLDAGEYDAVCSSVSITEERRPLMDFSLPYFWDKKVRQTLVVKKDSPIKEVKKLKQVKSGMLGAQKGTTSLSLIEKTKGVTGKPYDNLDTAMRDLAEGRIDGVICDSPAAKEYASKKYDFAGKLRIAGLLHDSNEYYAVAVKKGAKELLRLINKGIEQVQAKGVDKELRLKWLGE